MTRSGWKDFPRLQMANIERREPFCSLPLPLFLLVYSENSVFLLLVDSLSKSSNTRPVGL